MRFFAVVFLTSILAACATAPADRIYSGSAAATDYEPMKIFDRLAGRTLRGEGTGPDGAPIVDIAHWEFILDGRAFQSTHKLEGGTYGGRTIFFYDEGAKEYVFHYFTTAGFHTIGVVTPTKTGFTAVEQVQGHPVFVEVQSEIIFDGEKVLVTSRHVDKDGNVSDGDGFTYLPTDVSPPFGNEQRLLLNGQF